jgi:23S rRNA (adenine2503-C2)-methyltransferase
MRAREEALFVELTLIDGVNDSEDDAALAASLFEGFGSEVRFNLLPMNPIGSADLSPSPPDRVRAFEQRLRGAGFFTMVRRARGETERAACGQLLTLESRERPR